MSASSIYPYFQVSDITKNVRIKIGSLRGKLWNEDTAQFDPQLIHPAPNNPSLPNPNAATATNSLSPSRTGTVVPTTLPPPHPTPSTNVSASILPFSSMFEQQTHLSRKEVELYVEVAIFSRGSLLALPSHTSYRSFPIEQIKWQEWLVFPIQYKDLAPTSTFVFTVYQIIYTQQPPPSTIATGTAAPSAGTTSSASSSSAFQQLSSASSLPSSSILSSNLPLGEAVAIPLGGASFTMFNKKGLLKLGRRRLNVFRGLDGQDTLHVNSSAPNSSLSSSSSHFLSASNSSPFTSNPSSLSNSSSATTSALEKIIRKYDQREIVCIKWLDRLALRRMEKMHQRETLPFPSEVDKLTLTIEFPPFKFPVVYYQKACNAPLPPLPIFDVPPPSFQQLISTSPSPPPFTAAAASGGSTGTNSALSSSPTPSASTLPAGAAASASSSSSSPSTTITGGAAVFLNPNHRGRLFLLHDPEIRRENPIELKAHKLARSARAIGRADPHLKPSKSERLAIAQIIANPSKRLSADAKELLWKYRYSLIDDKRALTKFLRCVNWSDVFESNQALELLEQWVNIDIADALELLSSSFSNEGVRQYGVKQLQRADDEEISNYLLQLVQALRYEPQYPSPLSLFLIARCSQTIQLANFFYWYVRTSSFVEIDRSDARKGQMFETIQRDFFEVLRNSEKGRQWFQILQDQSTLIRRLVDLAEQCRSVKRVEKKVERLRNLLAADGAYKDLRSFPAPIHSPVRPEIIMNGIIGEECSMFRSALAPMNLCFSVPNDKYRVMFKCGDDLRQDQLIIQLFNLMDSLLKKVKLDLNLTPYRVLATSFTDGFVELVPDSYTLTSILDRYDKDIGKFLQAHNPKPNQLNQALQTFVKSCAGYAVITYLLGIGDRHLDNVMMTKSGHLFHIDFSFIFGRDPKPFPPPIKFSKEMVEAMGGASSEKYKDFQKFCAIAFNILRQHASLILNLLWLMGDAGIPDLNGANGDVEKNLLKVQEKFRLDLSDEEAGSHIISLIDQSVAALFPRVMEQVHKWALYWK